MLVCDGLWVQDPVQAALIALRGRENALQPQDFHGRQKIVLKACFIASGMVHSDTVRTKVAGQTFALCCMAARGKRERHTVGQQLSRNQNQLSPRSQSIALLRTQLDLLPAVSSILPHLAYQAVAKGAGTEG